MYVDGTTKQRVQTLDDLEERDVIRNGRTSGPTTPSKKTAVHARRCRQPDGDSPGRATPWRPARADDPPPRPPQKALDAIGKYTTVKVSDNVRVAGQKAYQITLTPKDDSTLVGPRHPGRRRARPAFRSGSSVKAKGQSDLRSRSRSPRSRTPSRRPSRSRSLRRRRTKVEQVQDAGALGPRVPSEGRHPRQRDRQGPRRGAARSSSAADGRRSSARSSPPALSRRDSTRDARPGPDEGRRRPRAADGARLGLPHRRRPACTSAP